MTVVTLSSRPSASILPCLFSLEHIEAFSKVAQCGNITLAASTLQLSKSTVSKYMTELERQVGVKLLHRSTHAVSLTAAGRVLLHRSQSVVELTAQIHLELREHASAATG